MMFKNFILSVSLAMAVATFLVGNAFAGHPFTGHEPRSIEHTYTGKAGMPVEWSFGNIALSPTRMPVDQLSDAERYIVAGAESSRYSSEVGLAPWTTTVLGVVTKFHKAYGYIPEQMTPEMIRSIPGYEEMSDESMDLFRSPITEEWPMLDCDDFNAGNLYIRVLTPAEIDHFAALVPMYAEMWTEGYWKVPGTDEYKCIDLQSPIFFMRIYGSTDVLYESIDFIWDTYE